ncbi:NifB/NifX family molybdenum-iron cluster-binding protein [Verrucomicrobiota bacterium]
MIHIKDNAVLVILLAVLVLCPWPILGLPIKPKSSADIVVVPSEGATLSSPVSLMFGRSRYFLIVDTSSGDTKVIRNAFRTETHAVGLRVAHLILNAKAGVAIARNMGPEPFNNLTARGVHVYVGNPSTVRDAIRQLSDGMLTKTEKPTVQIHFGLEQQEKTQRAGRAF